MLLTSGGRRMCAGRPTLLASCQASNLPASVSGQRPLGFGGGRVRPVANAVPRPVPGEESDSAAVHPVRRGECADLATDNVTVRCRGAEG